MDDYNSMPYDDKTGLVHVTEFEKDHGSYSFDTFMVLFNPDNQMYYWGEDDGCSCPSPFQDFSKISDYEGPLTKQEMVNKIRSVVDELPKRKEWVKTDGVEVEQVSTDPELLDSLLASAKLVQGHTPTLDAEVIEQKAIDAAPGWAIEMDAEINK